MKKLVYLVIGLALILSACSSPTPTAAPTQAAVPPTEAPTPANGTQGQAATSAPTEVPTATPTEAPTNTPEPTATPTPAAQPISAANVANLAQTGTIDIPRQPNLVLNTNLSGEVGGYTSDSQHIVLRSDSGVDVLSVAKLEVEKQFPGMRLAALLSDGRFAAVQGNSLVKVNPATGDMETVKTDADFSGRFAVSPTGEQAASVADAKTLRVYSLTGGDPLDIPLKKSQYPDNMFFTGDGVHLVLEFLYSDPSRIEVYDAATAKKLYEFSNGLDPAFSTDGKHYVLRDFNGVDVYDVATGKPGAHSAANVIYHRGLAGDAVKGALVEDRIDLMSYFVVGGPENGIAFYTHSKTYIDNPQGQWNTDLYKTDNTYETYVQDFTTGKQKFAFAGYGLDQLAVGFGAPDNSTFLLINKKGQLALHSLKDGGRLALSDRYTVGGGPVLSPDGTQVAWSNLIGAYVYDWQNAKSVMEQKQTLPLSASAAVAFLPDGKLLVESVPGGGSGLDIWDMAKGTIDTTVPALSNCQVDTAGQYVLCTAPSTGARRILALNNPDKIVFNTNDPNITILSPTGDAYATCKPGDGSIKYKKYAAPATSIKQPCQSMFITQDGASLVLQNGTVIGLADGKPALTLEADANGKAFGSGAPVTFFGKDFILIDNRAFDKASGKFLGQLPISGALGYALSTDGLTLDVLTGHGLEQWQVVK